jgi:hypothetical protein
MFRSPRNAHWLQPLERIAATNTSIWYQFHRLPILLLIHEQCDGLAARLMGLAETTSDRKWKALKARALKPSEPKTRQGDSYMQII